VVGCDYPMNTVQDNTLFMKAKQVFWAKRANPL
jgi:hypothetical protein